MKGVAGRLLDIDLTTGKSTDYSVSDDTIKKYLGGRGLGARLLYDLVPVNTDPFSPENVLMFLTGPLTGTKVPGSSKFVVVTKSPLTNGWCDSYSSGKLPVEIKKAGYDGIIIRGKANHPCYIKIDEKGAHIREADRIWGKDSFETDRILREIEKSPNAGVTSIGPAGEKLSRYACINSELYRQAGRGGVGAVMGSKNLKAIVARSKGRVEQHDRAKLVAINREQYEASRKSEVATARMRYGTSLTLNITHTGGILPTKNFQYGTWEDALAMIDSKGVYASTIARKACLSCFTPCAMVTQVKEGKSRYHICRECDRFYHGVF
ncbi:MAG: hypothetical protein JRG79_20780 [Deltaproteobacteria bacterium]|nr:hypothetical protein [Deltaproteobacteria bacterium]